MERGTRVVLRDGSEVVVDQVHHTDAQLLSEGFDRLSEETRRLRFLTAKSHLSEKELEYFTHLDHHDHEALGAIDPVTGRGVGLARYIREPGDPDVAEVAVTVADDWQGRGLGTELMHRILERAKTEGIQRFSALVQADNDTMIQVLQEIGGELHETERGAGVVGYEVTLPTSGHPHQIRELLRTFARRQARARAARRSAREDEDSQAPAEDVARSEAEDTPEG